MKKKENKFLQFMAKFSKIAVLANINQKEIREYMKDIDEIIMAYEDGYDDYADNLQWELIMKIEKKGDTE